MKEKKFGQHPLHSRGSLPDDLRPGRSEWLVVASQTLNRASGLGDILRAILAPIKTRLDSKDDTTYLVVGLTENPEGQESHKGTEGERGA